MAAQREVMQMSLHPCSREQKLAQIQRVRLHSATMKEIANAERKKPEGESPISPNNI